MTILGSRGQERVWQYRNVLHEEEGAAPFVIGFAQDVTEQAAAQRALRESEERLRALAENVDVVFFVDQVEPPASLYVSPAFERVFGRPASAQPEAATLFEDAHVDDRPRLIEAFERASAGGFDEVYRIVRPDGALRWLHTRTFPVRSGVGQPAERRVGACTDITAQKEAERLREDLVNMLVHDLRGPLMGIGACFELLGEATAERSDLAEVVSTGLAGTAKLGVLIDTLLDIERLERGTLELAYARVPLGPLTDEVLALARPAAALRRVSLVSKVAPSLPGAWGDRALLLRVLENLVGNAVKFTPQGGTVEVAAAHAAGRLQVRIHDSGPGIARDVAPRLFERFSAGRVPGAGTGLGLAFCRLVVEAHGGHIDVERSSPAGTAIRFTLALAPGTTA